VIRPLDVVVDVLPDVELELLVLMLVLVLALVVLAALMPVVTGNPVVAGSVVVVLRVAKYSKALSISRVEKAQKMFLVAISPTFIDGIRVARAKTPSANSS